MKRTMMFLALFALMLMAAVWTTQTTHAESPAGGTIGPIIPKGTPPDGWKDGSTAWVSDGSFQLPDADPHVDSASVQYEVHIQGEKTTVQSWSEVVDLLLNGAVAGSIWRQPWANQELPIANPSAEWCAGTSPWITNGTFKFPENDSCSGTALYQVDLNGVKHENQTWQSVKALTQNGTVSASVWRIQQAQQLNNSLYLPLISSN